MYFLVKHLTSFRYDEPVCETVMEVRKKPRNDRLQHCLSFELDTHPGSHPFTYQDPLGNFIHHFDLPGTHQSLDIVAEATIEMFERPLIKNDAFGGSWEELRRSTEDGTFFDWLAPSHFAQTQASPHIEAFLSELSLRESTDPLSALFRLNHEIYERFEYRPKSTSVDSPIEHALELRAGVCQDFSHLMIVCARLLGIPCRYVSGYLHHRTGDKARSVEDASHAWVEAWLPQIGWLGFDPTNDRLEDSHHIRIAIGRDYHDVAPTRGVYRGKAAENLSVAVSVFEIPEPMAKPIRPTWSCPASSQGTNAKLGERVVRSTEDQ